MYIINQQTNSIQKIEETTFKEIGASERNHLQEWIAKNPEVLCGEDEKLLIIQKEFAGFSDTRERLDLLALDNNGNLVIIENKLDDSGKDVTWQGLKYASYCSTLSTKQIISIFQQFLSKEGIEDDAEKIIREELDFEDEDLLLNDGEQRLIFVSHKFRKEVTSTVLWLIDRGINVKCFKAVPFKINDALLLQIEQIIPLPETEEMIIQMQEKQRLESQKKKVNSEMEEYYESLWKSVKSSLNNTNVTSYGTSTGRHYLRFNSAVGNMRFVMVATAKLCRVELYISNDANSSTLIALQGFSKEISKQISQELEWQMLPGKKSSRLKMEVSFKELNDKAFQNAEKYSFGELETSIVEWLTHNAPVFYEILIPFVKKIAKN